MKISVLISFEEGDRPQGLFHKLAQSSRREDIELVIVEYDCTFDLPVPLMLKWSKIKSEEILDLKLNEWVLDLPAFTMPIGDVIDEVLKEEQFGKTLRAGPNFALLSDDDLMNFHPLMLVDAKEIPSRIMSCLRETWENGKKLTKLSDGVFLTS